jgi:hypothetical protein
LQQQEERKVEELMPEKISKKEMMIIGSVTQFTSQAAKKLVRDLSILV